MPLTFLHPGLLFGAAAAALPVILHFLSRRRARHRMFSDLRFLAEVQSRQSRALGVRRWLLLLLRVLALLAIVMAAAGPRWGGLAGGGGGGSYLFVIDTSASLNLLDAHGSLLEEALADGAQMINRLSGDATVQVITAGSRTEALFGDWLPAGAGAAGALASVSASDGGFDLTAVLREAARQAARAPASPVELIFIGDLQTPPPDASWADAARALNDARPVRIFLRSVAAPSGVDGGVVNVALPQRALRPGETIRLVADVVAAEALQVFTVEIDGRVVAEAVATGNAGQRTAVEFALNVPAAGLHMGLVRKETDRLAVDDARPFVLSVPERLVVLLAHGQDRPGDGAGGRGGWRYVSQALAPGGAPGPFDVVSLASDQLTTGALAAASVVVLVNPDPLGRAALAALLDRVQGGGGLLLVAGDPQLQNDLTSILLPSLGLPAEAAFRAALDEGRHARLVDAGHPVFDGLDAAARQSLADIAWHRWFGLPAGDYRVVLELTGEDPLLVERDWGLGRVAMLTTDLSPHSCDLAVSPMALPLVQRLVAWLGRPAGTDGSTNLLAGQEAVIRPMASVPASALADAGALTAVGPVPGEVRAVDLVWRGAVPLLNGGICERSGFMVFKAGHDTVGMAAVAVPPAETILPALGAGGWRDLLAGLGLSVSLDLTDSEPSALAAVLAGRDLAPWLLGLALILLAIELAVGSGAGAPKRRKSES